MQGLGSPTSRAGQKPPLARSVRLAGLLFGWAMPKQYTAMRDKFRQQGMSKDRAQAKAARIYNSRHKTRKVTGKGK